MNHESPAPDEVPADVRERNGTGANADQQQLGLDEEEVNELEDDAEGG